MFGFALPESSRGGVDAASVAFMPDVLLTRPCVVVSQSELEAHEARLAKLRKIAGHVLWDAI
uniref:hypothetical protein n=1 Tax=Xylella fastidiosa TaxID=2371 RepID=UPI003F69B52B